MASTMFAAIFSSLAVMIAMLDGFSSGGAYIAFCSMVARLLDRNAFVDISR